MKDWLDKEYAELENEIGVLKAEIPLALRAFDKRKTFHCAAQTIAVFLSRTPGKCLIVISNGMAVNVHTISSATAGRPVSGSRL